MVYVRMVIDPSALANSVWNRTSRYSADEVKTISGYLESGVILYVAPGIDRDIFNNKPLPIPPRILTDGVWAWSTSLIHYVQRYDVALPAEFVQHMRDEEWTVKAASVDPDDVSLV